MLAYLKVKFAIKAIIIIFKFLAALISLGAAYYELRIKPFIK